jgi:hypothetical protein
MTIQDLLKAVDNYASDDALSPSERYDGLQEVIEHANEQKKVQYVLLRLANNYRIRADTANLSSDSELHRIFGVLYCGMMGIIFLLSILQIFLQHYSLRILAPFAQGEGYTTSDLDRFWFSYSHHVAIVSAILLALYGITAAINNFHKWQCYRQQFLNFLLRKSRAKGA